MNEGLHKPDFACAPSNGFQDAYFLDKTCFVVTEKPTSMRTSKTTAQLVEFSLMAPLLLSKRPLNHCKLFINFCSSDRTDSVQLDFRSCFVAFLERIFLDVFMLAHTFPNKACEQI